MQCSSCVLRGLGTSPSNMCRLTRDLLVWFSILLAVHGDELISVPLPDKMIADQGDDVRFVCQVTVPSNRDPNELKIKWKRGPSYIKPKERPDKYRLENGGQTLVILQVDSSDAASYACIVYLEESTDIARGWLVVKVPPDAPRNVAIISCMGNKAELNWQAEQNGGAEIMSFLVQFNTSENVNFWNNYYEEIPSDMRTTHINLAPWGTYSFRMLARNSVGYSEPSLPTRTRCTTPPDRPGGNPKDVRTLTHKKGKLIVTWKPMPRLYHNGPGFKYIIYWRRKGSTYWMKDVVTEAKAKVWETHVNDTYGLYEIKVKAENDIGTSFQPAFIYQGHSGESEPVVKPKDFRLDPTHPVTAHKAHFIWEAVETAETLIRGDFKGYKLRYWKSEIGSHDSREVDIILNKNDNFRPDIRVMVENLPAFSNLRADVAVMNTHYTGPRSSIIDFQTPEGVPGRVVDLHIEARGETFVLLKWEQPTIKNGVLLGYDIGYMLVDRDGDEKGPIKTLKPQIDGPETTGARITGLTANHKYQFYVWARTRIGRGEPVYLEVKTQSGRKKSNYSTATDLGDLTQADLSSASLLHKNISYRSSQTLLIIGNLLLILTLQIVFH